MRIARYKPFLVCTAGIFALSPLGRLIQLGFRSYFSDTALLAMFVYVSLTGALVLALACKSQEFAARKLTAIGLTFAALAGVAFALRADPEEAFHLWEYGLLSFFALELVSNSLPDLLSRIDAAFLATIVGILEELFQWILPNRYFDFRDIRLNACAALMLQLALLVCDTACITRPIAERSKRIFIYCCTALSSLCLLISVLTPQNIESFAVRFPALEYLRAENVIDFGVLNSINGWIIFRSHFSEDELRNKDQLRGAEVQRLLLTEASTTREDFLAKYSAGRDPFVNEAEVHIFRRNHYWQVSLAGPDDHDAAKIVFGEQEILSAFFPVTSGASLLDQSTQSRLERTVDKSSPYESAVESQLITSINQNTLLLAGAISTAVCLLLLLFKKK